MSDKPTDSRVNRRTVLQGVGSAVGATSLSNVVGAAERKRRIVTGRGGLKQEPVEKKKVPVHWHEHEKALRQVYDQLFGAFQHIRNTSEFGDHLIAMYQGGSSRSIGGYTATQPVVEIAKEAPSGLEERLPSVLKDVGVSTSNDLLLDEIRYERINQNQTLLCGGAETTIEPYPGGIVIWEKNQSTHQGTSGYRMHDGSQEYMLTANHVFVDSCTTKATGEVAAAANNATIGTFEDAHALHDWCLVPANSQGVTDIANEIYWDGYSYTLTGYKTRDGIASMVGKTGEAYKSGDGTGYRTGTIRGYNEGGFTGCPRFDTDGVKTEVDVAPGDSGGPIFDLTGCRYGSCEALAINNMSIAKGSYNGTACDGDSTQPKTVGWPAYKIVNNNSYTVG
ncbi:hypothetical protein [Halobaculum sp. P14]|uniref:hypothetical protein n=1 Tax=Halobacteriales TaxID=2235 RepID=UPI003EB9F8A4